LIIDGELGRHLESYFGSFFRIYSAVTYRTHAVEPHIGSFLWHRDTAPMSQIHVIVYLTDSGPETGATFALNIRQTVRAASLGYHFESLEDRIQDIDTVFADVDEIPEVVRHDVAAGDSLVIAPSRVLHRGSLPKTGYRDTFTLIILPSMTPWRRDIEEFGDDHVFQKISSATLSTNPFEALSPLIPEETERGVSVRDQWVLTGQMFP